MAISADFLGYSIKQNGGTDICPAALFYVEVISLWALCCVSYIPADMAYLEVLAA